MNDRFATLVIFITAIAWAGFAVWLSVMPGALLTTFGVESTTPQMLTEVRAFYGGVEFAIALAMVVLWRRGNLFAALLIGGLPLAGSAAGRCFGMIVDGTSTIHAVFAVVEIVGAAFCLVGCVMVSRDAKCSESESR
jgi:hypothetical protein